MASTIQKDKMASAQEDQFSFSGNQLPEVEFHAWAAHARTLKVPTLDNQATEGQHAQRTFGLAKEVPEDVHEISLWGYIVDFSTDSSCTQVQQTEMLERASSNANKRTVKRGKFMTSFRNFIRKIPLIKHCATVCLKL